MHKRLLLALSLLLLPAIACASFGSCACAAPMLGLFTDQTLTVTVVQRYFPAEAAGVQVGDKLLDVRPAKPEPGLSSEPVPFTNEDGVNELLWYRVPSLVPTACCGGPRLPLTLRVERGGEIVELEITSGFYNAPYVAPDQAESPISPIGTPTPYPTPRPTVTLVPSGWKYF